MSKDLEFSVYEAAQILGVTTRSVLNYIKHKEIEAVKVGKSWFIKAPSLDAFYQRHGFNKKDPPPSTTLQEAKSQPIEAPSARTIETKRKKGFSISKLRLHQLCCEYLKKVSPDQLSLTTPEVKNKIAILKIEAIELLGAGYYSYSNHEKQALYKKARERVGGLLSIYYFSKESTNTNPPQSIQDLEELLLPAFAALIRKIEKGGQTSKHKNQQAKDEGIQA